MKRHLTIAALLLMIAVPCFALSGNGGGGSSGGGSGTVTAVSGTANQVGVATGTTTPVISLIGPYTPATYTAHGQLIGEGTGSIVAMAACATGTVPYGQGAADPICSTLVLPNAATAGDLMVATSANTIGSVADAATGQVLTSGGAGVVPAYSASPTISGANITSLSGTNISSGTVAAARGGTGNALQYVVQNLGVTTTPACNWANGYICTWSGGSPTLSVSNIPGGTTNPVTVELDWYTNTLGNMSLPATFMTVGTNGTSGTTWTGSNSLQCMGGSQSNYCRFAFTCDGTNCFYASGVDVRSREGSISQLATAAITVASGGVVATSGGGYSRSAPTTLASYPSCAAGVEGAMGTQTDSAVACVAGVTAAAGGSTHCQIYCNGTNWVRTGL